MSRGEQHKQTPPAWYTECTTTRSEMLRPWHPYSWLVLPPTALTRPKAAKEWEV